MSLKGRHLEASSGSLRHSAIAFLSCSTAESALYFWEIAPPANLKK